MVDTEFHNKALELLRQADEADQNDNDQRAAYLTAQAQVFATLQSSVTAFAAAETVDGLTAQLRRDLGELNELLADVKARMPAT